MQEPSSWPPTGLLESTRLLDAHDVAQNFVTRGETRLVMALQRVLDHLNQASIAVAAWLQDQIQALPKDLDEIGIGDERTRDGDVVALPRADGVPNYTCGLKATRN